MNASKFREPAKVAQAASLQRDLTERLVLTALHEAEAADQAEVARTHAEFLAEASMLVGMSLNSTVTRDAVAGMKVPILGTWSIVDLIEADGSITRLPMIHSDPDRQLLLSELARNWKPEPGDPHGVPAVQTSLEPCLVVDDVDSALERAAHSPANLRLLRQLGISALLTVPMINGNDLLGAVTLVSDKNTPSYTPDEIRLAQNLANRNAEALEHARMYTQTLLLREQAELASRNNLRFLGNISHELRTPLNAIMGYIELIGEEIHGPVTSAQRDDLARIRMNQVHLLELVNELLAFVQSGTPRANQIVVLSVDDAVARAVALVENTLSRKSLRYRHESLVPNLLAVADEERVSQILVNLLANAVKFTARGGRITTECDATEEEVYIRVTDNGIGIDGSKLEQIFEAFVQVHDTHPAEGGVGLGLAISRDLARSMHGELSVKSTRGEGSCFTLSLPRGG